LQVVGHESRAEPAPTIKDKFGAHIGNLLLDIAFDNAFAHVHCAREMPFGPFVILANVHKNESFARVNPLFNVRNIRFLDALLGILDKLQKLWRVNRTILRSPFIRKKPSTIDSGLGKQPLSRTIRGSLFWLLQVVVSGF
jgi:hypothetical protein